MNEIWSILKAASLVKFIQIIIIYFTPVRFDTSSQILLDKYSTDKLDIIESSRLPFIREFLEGVVEKFVTWDSVYFADLFVEDIKYEHQFVFCPLWWRLIKHSSGETPNFYTSLLRSLAISNICHVASSVVLFFLTRSIFSRSKLFGQKSTRLAHLSSMISLVSPAGVFLTAPYSESLCALLSFTAFYLRDASLRGSKVGTDGKESTLKSQWYSKILYLLSGTLVAVSFGVRANALLLGALFLYDLYDFYTTSEAHYDCVYPLIAGAQLFVAIIIQNWHAYSIFCPQRGEWCNYFIPSLFRYAQKHYWNNGFLSYWTPNNIPNFLFALPTILILTLGMRFFTVEYPVKEVLPVIIVNGLLLMGGLLFWHVQILTRVASFTPLMYWFLAALLVSNNSLYKHFAKFALQFIVIWTLAQTSLFAAFLPPA